MQPPRRTNEHVQRHRQRQVQPSSQWQPARRSTTQPRQPTRMPTAKEPNWLMRAVRVSKFYVIGVLGVALVLGIIFAVNDARVRARRADLEAAQEAVAAAYYEVSEKQRQLQFANTDEYIEREARERFGYIKADEIRITPGDGSVSEYYDVAAFVAARDEAEAAELAAEAAAAAEATQPTDATAGTGE